MTASPPTDFVSILLRVPFLAAFTPKSQKHLTTGHGLSPSLFSKHLSLVDYHKIRAVSETTMHIINNNRKQ
jgi:hypothetical protein